MNNNWHIRIEDCTEAQKARLQQFYGRSVADSKIFGFDGAGYLCFFGQSLNSNRIHPDEAFKRLGSDVDPTKKATFYYEQKIEQLEKKNQLIANAIGERKEQLLNADKLIKGLKEQLAEESEHGKNLERQLKVVEKRNWELKEQLSKQPLDVDWSMIEPEYCILTQDKDGYIDTYPESVITEDPEKFRILAIRPKPKYTRSEVDSAISLFSEWDNITRDIDFPEWAKEQAS